MFIILFIILFLSLHFLNCFSFLHILGICSRKRQVKSYSNVFEANSIETIDDSALQESKSILDSFPGPTPPSAEPTQLGLENEWIEYFEWEDRSCSSMYEAPLSGSIIPESSGDLKSAD